MKVVVIGSSNIDMVAQSTISRRLAKQSEMPVLYNPSGGKAPIRL